jgi:hypothetical protein
MHTPIATLVITVQIICNNICACIDTMSCKEAQQHHSENSTAPSPDLELDFFLGACMELMLGAANSQIGMDSMN